MLVKGFFVKCHPMELSAKNATIFVRNYFLVPFGGYVTETRILVSDQNIFSKRSMWRYLHEQAQMLVKGIRC